MSKKKDGDDAAGEGKPKSGMMKMLVGALLLLGLGAGGAYGAVHFGLLGPAAGEPAGPDLPKLVGKGDDDPYAAAGDQKDAAPAVYGEGGSEYRTAYYVFEEGFTSNLKDSPGLVQVSLAASTRHDGRVIQWLEMHELAIRSALLVELANTVEDDVYSVEGKQRMRGRLAEAINRVLEEQEGFGGVEDVHFQSFLVQ
ncbi:flagellar basal body-associated FliL family protein [Alteraurantiacibacter aquimixticola]|uniref:Flagellar protein FliL n=1 Tax=Alteraurantiacibacter aquimixticola TaxID=2489173 RepID=A0A4T3F578_9SPHN|nr:flagellar basal body-associated FliL family protein [Alteraurantiacibacter aquimixticola]TIX51534.1 flagellar basal body-associated FliL family protein [Alteraurantiacibacter aquimixticola]